MEKTTANGYCQSTQTPTDRSVTRSISGEFNRNDRRRLMHGQSSGDSGAGASISIDIETELATNRQNGPNSTDIGSNETRCLQCRQPSANGPDSGVAESPVGEESCFRYPPTHQLKHSNSEPNNHRSGFDHQHVVSSRQTEQASKSFDLQGATCTWCKKSFEGPSSHGDSFQSHSTSASLQRSLKRQKSVDQLDEQFSDCHISRPQISVESSNPSGRIFSNGSVNYTSPCFSLPSPPAVPKSSLDQVTMELIGAKLQIEQLNKEREIKEKHYKRQVIKVFYALSVVFLKFI